MSRGGMQQGSPGPGNDYLAEHVLLLVRSYRWSTGRDLLAPTLPAVQAARALWLAPFAVLSHGTDPDPLFNYANATALALFEMSWCELIDMPSRLSAEPLVREERKRLLSRVATLGYVDDYRGVRISRTGRRFFVREATVWNLSDEQGRCCGQAACLRRWEPVGE